MPVPPRGPYIYIHITNMLGCRLPPRILILPSHTRHAVHDSAAPKGGGATAPRYLDLFDATPPLTGMKAAAPGT